MKFVQKSLIFHLVAGFLLVSGCTTGPTYQGPDLSTPPGQGWAAEKLQPSATRLEASPPDLSWWERFQDPVLTGLVERLVGENPGLAQARERVVEARARRGVVDAERLPKVDLQAAYTRAATGEEAVTYQGPPPGEEADLFRLGSVAGWELDLWGRVKRLTEAADRDIEAEREAFNGLAISLVAELTLAYVEARTLEGRIALVKRNIGLQEQTLDLARAREEAGSGTRLEWLQVRRQLFQTRSLKPELERRLTLAKNRIAVLMGKTPAEETLPPGSLPDVPDTLGIGIPADLMVRRADIREAERRYAASVARIGAAMAEKYPRISLSGSFQLQNDEAGGVLDPDAFVVSLGPNLSFPLFEGGRIENQVRVRRSQAEQARLGLAQVLVQAAREVEDAATGVVRTRQRISDFTDAMDAARSTEEMARRLYASGLQGMMPLLDAQRELVAIEDGLMQARGNALAETVHLFRALGGGWDKLDLEKTNMQAGSKYNRPVE